jgi:hypothetical protein
VAQLDWESVKTLLVSFGLVRGLFVIFFLMAHYFIWKQYKGRLDDRQKEIDRLAQDNREYRERFLTFMDQVFSYAPKGKGVRTTKKVEDTE